MVLGGVELLLEDCASNGVRGDSRSDRRCVRAMIQLGGMGQSVIAISHSMTRCVEILRGETGVLGSRHPSWDVTAYTLDDVNQACDERG